MSEPMLLLAMRRDPSRHVVVVDPYTDEHFMGTTASGFLAELAAHDQKVKVAALREYATLVEEIANLGANNTGLRTPHHLAEYTRTYADRIESEVAP